MDKLKSLQVKRLSFYKKSKDYSRKEKSVASNNGASEVPILLESSEEKDSIALKRKHSIFKHCSSVTFSDPNLPLRFQELFEKNSNEVFLKRYKCVYVNRSTPIFGKIYISSNFLWFVECKVKNLELIIRLDDVQWYTTDDSSVSIFAYDQTHLFKDFIGSGVAFLSSYLRLTKAKNSVDGSGVVPDSSSISTSSSMFSAPDPPSFVSESASPIEDDQSSLRTDEPQFQKQSPHASQSSQLHLPNFRIPFDDTITMVSDVAYKASCIPLLILIRMLSFGVSIITNSLQVKAPFGFRPPRSFTKFIAYFMLAFLAISLAYIYCHLPQNNPTWSSRPGFYCRGEVEKMTSSLRSLSETLRRLETRLKEYEVVVNLRTVP